MFCKVIRWAVLLAAFPLAGCTPLVLFGTGIEQDRVAKTFTPPEDRSLIYVYLAEPNPHFFNRVVIDGRVAGMLRPSLYSISSVTPGRHRLRIGAEESDGITIEAEQGRTYFVDTRLYCENGAARAQLQLVDESIGREQILHSSIANITLFGVPLLDNESPVADCNLLAGKF